MLPKAEGCCTGLQLSAKEVVLGRPDMMIPLSDSPSLPSFLLFFLLFLGWEVKLMKNAALSSSPTRKGSGWGRDWGGKKEASSSGPFHFFL